MIDDQTYEKTIRGAWLYVEPWRTPEPAKQSRVQDCIDLGADSEPQMLDAIPTEPGDLEDTQHSVEAGLLLSVGLVFGGIALGWLLARWMA